MDELMKDFGQVPLLVKESMTDEERKAAEEKQVVALTFNLIFNILYFP